ncbi:hypothetical protein [Microbacterium hominis]|uniref:Uncharacterized protein n=1 Tax=Microbacterium hominis TaxID=162426 RepID=A0A7D4Q3Q3_9MICO|nr:hypothetical protein [Microbacterium hominis]QKJ20231.1 hypothetical protein HQM25_13255 [Microbacterium hominis]
MTWMPRSTVQRTLFLLAAAGVAAATVFVLVSSYGQARLWEDEAFNLTVPRNLVAGLGYSSDGTLSGSTITPFDVRISTGPALLLPIAGLLAIGIDPVYGGRAIAVLFWIALVAGLWIIGRGVAGPWGGLVAASTPLAVNANGLPSPVQGPADVLGEIPAAALIVWAAVAARRRPWLGGLLLGLAVQAKFIALLAIPALVLYVFFAVAGASIWQRILRVLPAAALAIVPTALFEGAKLLTLGGPAYIDSTRAFRDFVLSGGQAPAPPNPGGKLAALADAWFVPAWAAIVLAAIVLAGVVAAFVVAAARARGEVRTEVDAATAPPASAGRPSSGSLRSLAQGPVSGERRGPGSGDERRARERAQRDEGPAQAGEWPVRDVVLVGVLGLTGLAAYPLWWIASSHTPVWIRHPSPGMFAFAGMVVAVAWFGWRGVARSAAASRPLARARGRGVLAASVAAVAQAALGGIVLALAASVTLHAIVGTPFPVKLWDQQRVAARVSSVPEVAASDGLAVQWGVGVSIAFLAGKHVGLVDAGPAVAEWPRLWTGEPPRPCEELARVGAYVVCPAP